jgi:hypothetical protein
LNKKTATITTTNEEINLTKKYASPKINKIDFKKVPMFVLQQCASMMIC